MVKLHWDVSPFHPRSLYCAFHPRIIPESNPAGWIPQHASLILRGGFGKACSTVVFYCEGHAAAAAKKKKKSNQKHKPLQKVTTTWHTCCFRPLGRDGKSTVSISPKQKKKEGKKKRAGAYCISLSLSTLFICHASPLSSLLTIPDRELRESTERVIQLLFNKISNSL